MCTRATSMHQDLSGRLSFSHAPYGLFRVGTADISSVRRCGKPRGLFHFFNYSFKR